MSDQRPQAAPLDLALIGLSVLALIFSFFEFYTYSASGTSTSASAWHGVLGWLAVVLMVAGAVATLAWKGGAVAALYGAALLCAVLAIFIVPGGAAGPSSVGDHVVKGHGFGFWVVFVCSLVAAAIAAFRFRTRVLR